jgi:Fe-S cluster biogenesis protein NfuA/nitrite reductase/ring-hydroxylating ferredoxin subunit
MNRDGRRIEEIVARIDEMPNPAARTLMQECLQAMLGFYGNGLERILAVARQSGPGGEKVLADLVGDTVVSGLLLIHGLHPRDLATRLNEALAKVRPYMESHGGNVELLGLENDFARLRLQGSCQSCPSSSVTLELAVRSAIEEACPDLAGFHVEGLPVASAAAPHQPGRPPEWIEVPEAAALAEGAMMPLPHAGMPVILCRVKGQYYAYRDHCPACNLPLHLGSLEGETLACSLGHRYDAPRAGRALGGASSHLDPLPLLVRDGTVSLALPRENGHVPRA